MFLGMEFKQEHVRNVLKPRTIFWPWKVDLRPQAGPFRTHLTWAEISMGHGDLWFPDVAIVLPYISINQSINQYIYIYTYCNPVWDSIVALGCIVRSLSDEGVKFIFN